VRGDPDRLARLADYVSLVYHEARNVRHLIRAGAVRPDKWKYLIALPTNRDDAWKAVQGIRALARRAHNVAAVRRPFDRRFRVSVAELVTLYANEAWRNHPYGGNAWEDIARLVLDAAVALKTGRVSEADRLLEALRVARHNTGRVTDKLERLDRGLELESRK
jgi:hypothetical protein